MVALTNHIRKKYQISQFKKTLVNDKMSQLKEKKTGEVYLKYRIKAMFSSLEIMQSSLKSLRYGLIWSKSF